MPVPTATAPPDVSFSGVDETDPRRAEEHLTPSLRLDHAPEDRFTLHLHRVTRGPLGLDDIRCSEAVRIRLDDDPGYVVGLPVRGTLRAEHRGRDLDLHPGRAAVLTPFPEAAMTTAAGADVVLVRVRDTALEDALEALLGRPVHRPVQLTNPAELGATAGKVWSGVVHSVAAAGARPAAGLTNPMSADPLQDALLVGLLHLTDHPERDALDAPVPSWGPRPVRDCLDLVETHPELPLTSAGLAAHVGLSVRALQGCWRRHRDVQPRDDLDRVRMTRAHRDLEARLPGETTVAAVARAWGFPPRTFPAAYAARFGRPPELTLHGPAFA
jgi:AraC-like DNA-binding protein